MTKCRKNSISPKKNPAYGRHWISLCVQIVAPILKRIQIILRGGWRWDLHWPVLHCTALRCNKMHCIGQYFFALHGTVMHCYKHQCTWCHALHCSISVNIPITLILMYFQLEYEKVLFVCLFHYMLLLLLCFPQQKIFWI